MKNPEETIGKMIDKSGTSFVSYVDEDGYPITKAMLKPRKRNGIKEIWFSTNTSSDKVRYFRKNNKASIYFIDKRYFRGVSLIGTIEVLETTEAKEMIWQTGDEMFYKEGVSDPDYCVLKFTAHKGRYYSNFKSENFDI
ncbi:MAG TPA: pyridoxamine 5'-phosphate oxidase family protein [Candidatus Fournierella excrementavium]|uniref:Pyridoxamine 5'-phosphate oxidase family protein n=1 Tax=Candidatus Ruthenibacterium merdavium TaxID=2838752 RepID=A0A9D2Q5R8_9FIRM|nr:pyridoxamine 5'-phosphate oxidase family protein [Gemmiger formicilis]MBM6914700.1 pyridoxamine 5'-phosphate oxidase family protein [Gemmiger formicilis]HIS02851.1 pyridoxamine 5'-phosphate oxidase family protein [Candidatus Pullichristensenella avicola]HJC71385.1 pyridoxamine 5'-phosphate oxidase family protein [Candidatus Ruthenibacterium merdavium]HJD18664.1 pyridoxamine 5'-phosphate oxidase family protein [Candidatus Fournierella excrementavium]